MKYATMMFSLLFSSFAFAQEPNFKCVEQTGFKYNFFIGNPSKIEMLDEKNQLISVMTDLELEFMSIETLPSIDSYTFKYNDGGNEIAHIEFVSAATLGNGEMIDNDNTMVCERNKSY